MEANINVHIENIWNGIICLVLVGTPIGSPQHNYFPLFSAIQLQTHKIFFYSKVYKMKYNFKQSSYADYFINIEREKLLPGSGLEPGFLVLRVSLLTITLSIKIVS